MISLKRVVNYLTIYHADLQKIIILWTALVLDLNQPANEDFYHTRAD